MFGGPSGRGRRLSAAALLVLLAASLRPAAQAPIRPAALTPERVPSQYIVTSWQRADGLPQNSVLDVLQSRSGYLWAATQDGLARFDGLTFTVFNTVTDPALGTDDFSALLEDRHGTLWIGSAGGGVLTFREGVLEPMSTLGLPTAIVTDLYEEPDGTIWVATLDGLTRRAGTAVTTFTTAQGLPSNSVYAITRDPGGDVWVATGGGVARLRSGEVTAVFAPPELPSRDVRAIYTTRDGTVWIGTARGLVRYRDGTFTTLGPADGLSGVTVRAFYEDAAGTLWIGTQDGGVTRMTAAGFDHLGVEHGLPSPDVRAFTVDVEGNLWIGTNAGGLVRVKDPKAITFGVAEGLPHDIVLPIAADREGRLWVGTYGGGVARAEGGGWVTISSADGLSDDIALALAPSAAGGMWVGTRFGLDRVSGRRVERIGAAAGVPAVAVMALHEDRHGTLWVGTRAGAYRLADGRATVVDADGMLGRGVITAVHEAADGTIWFGTEGSGAARYSNGTVTPFDVGGPNAVVWSFTEDQQGALWIGTNGRGVMRYRDGRLVNYRARDGMIDDTIYRILDDGAGSLWFSSNAGIQRVPREQFELFDARAVPSVAGERFGEGDGMRSSEANGGVQPAGWRTPDGVLWFPTIRGLVRIDPRALAADRRPPPVVIEQVVIDGRPTAPDAALTLAPGVRALEFRYTALSLRAPDKVRFRYRLDGFDPDWVDGGDRRVAYYTNLPPDHYTFRVIAANDDGVWNEAGATTAVTLLPYFSQTSTFYLLAAATLGFVVFGLHRARVSGLRAREQDMARLAEERHWALVALQESENQFRTLFDNVNEGVYRSTTDGRIVLANRSMAALLGYDSVDELLKVPARDLYADPEDHAQLVKQVTESGEFRAVEVRLRRRDGREVVALESSRLVKEGPGGSTYFEGALVDITDRKGLEEQLIQLQKIESIGRLAGGVAHDLNNLLTPILGQAELLADELPPDDRRRGRVDQIQKAALSARSFTRQLLAFSRRQILKRRVLDLNEALTDIQEILRRLIGEHIDLRFDRAPDLARIRADAGQLEQVVINLVVNARDAMPMGGQLTIQTATVTLDAAAAAHRAGVEPGRYVLLAVTDTGSGISEEVRSRLFEPFVTTKAQGHGLGLSLVHGIVTQSGGHIVVDSEVGRGTSFRVYLPAIDEVAEARQPPAAAAAPAEGQTILLVEDEEDVREVTGEILERAGYRVLVATDADHAQRIEADFGEPIDLLLTDVIMPGMGGPALAERLRPRRPSMRVLYTTGYIDDDVAHHGVLRPDVMVLEKPFTLDALLQAVQACLQAPPPADRG